MKHLRQRSKSAVESRKESQGKWARVPCGLGGRTEESDLSTAVVYMFRARRLYVPRPPSIWTATVERSYFIPEVSLSQNGPCF